MGQCIMFPNGEGNKPAVLALTMKVRASEILPPESFNNIITSFIYPAGFTTEVFCEYESLLQTAVTSPAALHTEQGTPGLVLPRLVQPSACDPPGAFQVAARALPWRVRSWGPVSPLWSGRVYCYPWITRT